MIRQTSIEVFHKIQGNGLLSKMRFAVYEALFLHGPLTGRELNAHLKTPSAHKRLSELKELGVARDSGSRTRPCQVSGENVVEWDVTDQLPVEPAQPDPLPGERPGPVVMGRALEEFREMYRLATKVGFKPTEATTRLGAWLAKGAP